MREMNILNFLLDLSPELKSTYVLYQELIFELQTKNLNRLNNLLEAQYFLMHPELQITFQTFKTRQLYIKNMLSTPYTNGPSERINNKIKVIKQIAFGYRSFYHFKSCIPIIQNSTRPKVKILANSH